MEQRDDSPCDKIPLCVEVERNDRLDIEDINGVVIGSDAKKRIILKGHANHTGDWILRGFAQLIFISRLDDGVTGQQQAE